MERENLVGYYEELLHPLLHIQRQNDSMQNWKTQRSVENEDWFPQLTKTLLIEHLFLFNDVCTNFAAKLVDGLSK